MTTTQQTALQLAARHLVEAQDKAHEIHLQGDPYCARLANLMDTLNHLGRALEAAGASAPTDGYQGSPPPAPDSLEALARIEGSRAEGEALLTALAQILPLAEALDKKRGDWVGDMAHTELGETPGTNYAETIQELQLGLRMELRGAKGGTLDG